MCSVITVLMSEQWMIVLKPKSFKNPRHESKLTYQQTGSLNLRMQKVNTF